MEYSLHPNIVINFIIFNVSTILSLRFRPHLLERKRQQQKFQEFDLVRPAIYMPNGNHVCFQQKHTHTRTHTYTLI